MLPILRTGEAIIVGEAVSLPIRTIIAPLPLIENLTVLTLKLHHMDQRKMDLKGLVGGIKKPNRKIINP